MTRAQEASSANAEALRAALERAKPEPVEVRETHISWVFLARDRAYKLKKPLVLPFLDYGSPGRRHEMCAEEVRLNRRLAPSIYVGVRAVVLTDSSLDLADEDHPDAVDYVVEMERYDEHRTLAATLDRGELRLSEVVELARALAQFHAGCPPASGHERGAHRVEREVDRNAEELLGVAEQRAERERIRKLARFLTAFVAAHSTELDAREEHGWIREGHGDLRAEHVVLGSPLSVVDCVEFDRDLRTLDVADDLAFLVTDLAALGGERFAARLVSAYRAAGGDCGGDALLAFFAVHRAMVRAKVLLVRAEQQPGRSAARGHASAQARDLLALAECFAWRARLPLAIVICGAPASGKSQLASALAKSSRLPVLSSDLVRKRLAGIPPTERASRKRYGDHFSLATYGALGRRAATEIAAHGGVLVDATFRRRRDRDAFAQAFRGAARIQFVECVAPTEVLAARAVARERDPRRVSDATLEVVMREGERWEPLDEVPARAHVVVRADRPVDAIVADVIALLDERLS